MPKTVTVALRKESVDRNKKLVDKRCKLSWSLSARRAWIEIGSAISYRTFALGSLSARRAWIEIGAYAADPSGKMVALRKESVDRNASCEINICIAGVALRKESVDRNLVCPGVVPADSCVALRKESVDRNLHAVQIVIIVMQSLSARRAWIEIVKLFRQNYECFQSLSARRAWIEIRNAATLSALACVALRKESVDRNTSLAKILVIATVALRKESVDRNRANQLHSIPRAGSLSARRAWIEILKNSQKTVPKAVALRKESVDRNAVACHNGSLSCLSLSARRAWIEISPPIE